MSFDLLFFPQNASCNPTAPAEDRCCPHTKTHTSLTRDCSTNKHDTPPKWVYFFNLKYCYCAKRKENCWKKCRCCAKLSGQEHDWNFDLQLPCCMLALAQLNKNLNQIYTIHHINFVKSCDHDQQTCKRLQLTTNDRASMPSTTLTEVSPQVSHDFPSESRFLPSSFAKYRPLGKFSISAGLGPLRNTNSSSGTGVFPSGTNS